MSNTAVAQDSAAIALTRAQQVNEAITRLDDCAARLERHRDRLGEELYADLVSQAYMYASLLTECKVSGLSLLDPRLREVTNEMVRFCHFLEAEMPD